MMKTPCHDNSALNVIVEKIQTQTKEKKKIQDGVIIAKVLNTQERHVGNWMEGHNKGTRIENFPSLIRVSKLK